MVESRKPRSTAGRTVKQPTVEPVEESGPPPRTADGLAIRLRTARERKGLSLSDLHRRSGFSKTALHDYESGRTKPGARELRSLCELLEVTPNWLVFGAEEPFAPRPGLKSLVKLRNGGPMAMMVAVFVVPLIIAALDEQELESLLALIGALVEARDPEGFKTVTAMAETMTELYGEGSPADLAAWSEKAGDPEFLREFQEKVKARLGKGG